MRTCAIFNTNSSNILQVAANKELWVWTGDSYTPGARVKTHDLEVKGTMAMGTNGLTVTGSLLASAGTFTTSTGITLGSVANSETLNLGTNVTRNLTLDGALWAHFKFDEGTGTFTRDASKSKAHGSLTAPIWSGSNLNTRTQFYNPYALRFDGSSTVMTAAVPTPSLPFTIAFWARPNSASPVGMFDFAPNQGDVIRNYSSPRLPLKCISGVR